MSNVQNLLLISLLVGFVLLEYLLGRVKTFNTGKGDSVIDLLSMVLLAGLTQPFIFFVVGSLGDYAFPDYRDALAALPWSAMAAMLLIGDDMTQYWWHRVSHSPMLWPLHRAHHSPQYMSARIIYRNNFFYYLCMPGLWISGILIFLGFAEVYLVYIVIKLAVITGAHSAVKWDAPLYRIKALKPLMWLVQRTVSTPSTHYAHHAMYDNDGIGHYKGNFGNLLFFWDVLFGTAHITQKYPAEVGLRDDQLFGRESWWVQLFYPLFRSRRAHSALIPGGKPYEEPSPAEP
jgi:sterol desaturase/sphingolipid hydroxylase (fatty acid hydroxylase superfamily)